MPTTRPGWLVAVEISVTDSDEVLVARTVSGTTISSRLRNSSCFSGSCSTIASTTSWQSAGEDDGSFHRVRYTGKPVNMNMMADAREPTLRTQAVSAAATQPDDAITSIRLAAGAVPSHQN